MSLQKSSLRTPLAEVLAAFSYALDLTEGQPEGHCIRACWIGTHIGQEIGLTGDALSDLYYTLLLKDLGCSSNAARISELYLADDRSFKHDFKLEDSGLKNALKFVFKHTGAQSTLPQRLRAIGNIMRNGSEIVHEMIQTRCTRGASIARKLRFSEAVANGIHSLDEHWDGSGHPSGLKGDDIPLFSRIALLSQVIDVFFTADGKDAALTEAENRAGRWFDPSLVEAFTRVARRPEFWNGLAADDIETKIFTLPPALANRIVDDSYMDDITDAFGEVIDAKSPFTAGHSERVGEYARLIGQKMGMSEAALKWLRRAACLHDVGKLGVSNTILDKPGKLTDEEWEEMRRHTVHSHTILGRISVFQGLADAAASHHERLDGSGYPHNLSAEEITLETRIISAADFYDALTADRPYRAAMTRDDALAIMRKEIGRAIDADCFAALCDALKDLPVEQAAPASIQPLAQQVGKA